MHKVNFTNRFFLFWGVLSLIFMCQSSAWALLGLGKSHKEKIKICKDTTRDSKSLNDQTQSVIKASPQDSSSRMCNSFTFDGTESYDPNNRDLTFAWDFGDGSTATEAVVPHIYAKPGVYKVKLTITNNTDLECSTATKTQMVTANIAPTATMSGPEFVCLNEAAQFDAKGSSSTTGSQLKYRWNLGDGSRMEGSKISKIYEKAGDYKVRLSVDDNAGTACSVATVEKIVHVNEAPVAHAGEDVVLQCLKDAEDLNVTFDASKSKGKPSQDLTYTWDFGDGKTGEGKVAEHQYNQSGKYKAVLTVSDNSGLACSSSKDTVSIQLSRAPKADAGKDIAVCLGDEVDFDGGNSYVEDRESLFSRWDFGDGASERGLKVKHIYNKVGTYKATLTVENAYTTTCPQASDTKIVNVNTPPNVCLKASQESGCVGSEIIFEAIADDPDADKMTYFWNFGDGQIIKGGPTMSHTFDKGGLYKVSVVVDDGKGSECSTAQSNVSVKINTPPKADAGENQVCCIDQLTNFDGAKSSDEDNDELTYTWDFGDGTQSAGAKTTHTYGKGGAYKVFLRVDDNTGTECAVAEDGFTADVSDKPVPVIKVK